MTATQVTKVDFYMGEIPNKPGEGARILNAFKDAGINMTVFLGYKKNARKAEIVVVGGKPAPVAKKLGVDLGRKQAGLFVTADDTPGALAGMFTKLAEAGINIESCHGICTGEGRFGALVVVASENNRKALKLLGK